MTAEEYRAKVLKTILEYESHFNAVDDYEVKDAIAYLYEIIRGIDAMPSAERTEWIPVSERPPEIGEDVFFCDIDGDIYRGHRAKHRWWSEVEDVKDVVAWMPLPKPYEEG